MDPFKLLSRSTNLSRKSANKRSESTPSSGRADQPQLFAKANVVPTHGPGKRKRGQQDGLPGSRNGTALTSLNPSSDQTSPTTSAPTTTHARSDLRNNDVYKPNDRDERSTDTQVAERIRIFRQHKLKATWLNPDCPSSRSSRKDTVDKKAQKVRTALYPNPLESLRDLRARYAVSKRLANNLEDNGFVVPTEIQIAALPLLLGDFNESTPGVTEQAQKDDHGAPSIDLLAIAPTGSGKTMAFMIPLVHRLHSKRRTSDTAERFNSAVILAPTKELVSQIVNEGRKLAKNTGVTISQMRKGSKLAVDHEEDDEEATNEAIVKTDIIVSTPGIFASSLNEKSSAALRISSLILDEADVLLDPLFRDQTLAIWNSLKHEDLRVSMWSATMGSNIEELVQSTLRARRTRLSGEADKNIPETPLVRLVVGLKDAAVPNVQHVLTYAATEKGKLTGLRQLISSGSASDDSGRSTLRPPTLVFTQTIERAVALHSELLYEIPSEAGGSSRVAVLHSDLSDTARDNVMSRFRKGEIWLLITTDLLSRGVDFRGVNGVVNYDIPTSSAAYVHRIGRTGRAGRDGGVAVTLYSKEDIPYLQPVVNVVKMAEQTSGLQSGVPQWLQDALPKLSKNDRKDLKKRGVESRTARGKEKDPRAARRSRISTKAGFVRKAENRRRGAIQGSRDRQFKDARDALQDPSEFEGLD